MNLITDRVSFVSDLWSLTIHNDDCHHNNNVVHGGRVKDVSST